MTESHLDRFVGAVEESDHESGNELHPDDVSAFHPDQAHRIGSSVDPLRGLAGGRWGSGAAVRSVQTGVDIAAEPSVVWDVLTDFANYPAWSSFVQEISGSLEPGGRVRVVQGVEGRRPFAFSARVLDATAGRGFTWRGGVPGLYVGTHEFVLTALPGGGTNLLQRETFRGLLTGVLGAPRSWLPGFSSFNEALRRRVESIAGAA